MSKIIKKPYNPAQGIIRAEMEGSPNLITTSDLNRQFEIEYQRGRFFLDSVGADTDYNSGFSFETTRQTTMSAKNFLHSDDYLHDKNSIKFTLNSSVSFVRLPGIDLKMSKSDIISKITSPANINSRLYSCLYAKRTLVTSQDDPTKKISGAKFEDGQIADAASHYVFTEPKIYITNTVDETLDGRELITVLEIVRFKQRKDAKGGLLNSANIIIEKNKTSSGGTPLLGSPTDRLKQGATLEEKVDFLLAQNRMLVKEIYQGSFFDSNQFEFSQESGLVTILHKADSTYPPCGGYVNYVVRQMAGLVFFEVHILVMSIKGFSDLSTDDWWVNTKKHYIYVDKELFPNVPYPARKDSFNDNSTVAQHTDYISYYNLESHTLLDSRDSRTYGKVVPLGSIRCPYKSSDETTYKKNDFLYLEELVSSKMGNSTFFDFNGRFVYPPAIQYFDFDL